MKTVKPESQNHETNMRLANITADGINGLRFSHDLGPVNIFVGRNFSGKTARLNTIRLVLMGYLPELGKTGASTMALAGNGVLTVSGKTDKGSGATRSWASIKGGAVKATTVGDLPETHGVLPNPETYFELGAKDQIRYVLGLSKVEAPEFTADAIIAAIKSIWVDGHGEAHERVIQQQVGYIDSNDRVRHEAGQSIQDWVEALCVEMRGKLALARAGQKRMAETVRGQTTLTAGDDAQTRDCEAELKQATEAVGVLRGTVTGLERDRTRLAIVIDKRRLAEQQIAGTTDLKEAIEQAERGLSEMRAKCDGHKSQHADVAARLRLASAANAVDRHGVEQTVKEIFQLKADHEQNVAADKCPHCGAHGDGWQASIIAKFNEREKSLKQFLIIEEQKALESSNAIKSLERELQIAITADDVDDKRRKELYRMQASVNTMRRQQSDLDQAKATLAGIEPVAPGAVEALSAQMADKAKESSALNERVIDMTRRQRQYVQWRQDEARNAQAILAGLEVTAEVEVLKAVVAILEALQVAMVKKAFETILERANKVTKGIMLTPLEYHDGEIGRFQGGQWISHRTFSGTEKALCYAGISVALAWDAPIKIVLMDELGRIDAAHQVQLIQRMIELTKSGAIDQFVGAATAWMTNEDGVNVIRL